MASVWIMRLLGGVVKPERALSQGVGGERHVRKPAAPWKGAGISVGTAGEQPANGDSSPGGKYTRKFVLISILKKCFTF